MKPVKLRFVNIAAFREYVQETKITENKRSSNRRDKLNYGTNNFILSKNQY